MTVFAIWSGHVQASGLQHCLHLPEPKNTDSWLYFTGYTLLHQGTITVQMHEGIFAENATADAVLPEQECCVFLYQGMLTLY